MVRRTSEEVAPVGAEANEIEETAKRRIFLNLHTAFGQIQILRAELATAYPLRKDSQTDAYVHDPELERAQKEALQKCVALIPVLETVLNNLAHDPAVLASWTEAASKEVHSIQEAEQASRGLAAEVLTAYQTALERQPGQHLIYSQKLRVAHEVIMGAKDKLARLMNLPGPHHYNNREALFASVLDTQDTDRDSLDDLFFDELTRAQTETTPRIIGGLLEMDVPVDLAKLKKLERLLNYAAPELENLSVEVKSPISQGDAIAETASLAHAATPSIEAVPAAGVEEGLASEAVGAQGDFILPSDVVVAVPGELSDAQKMRLASAIDNIQTGWVSLAERDLKNMDLSEPGVREVLQQAVDAALRRDDFLARRATEVLDFAQKNNLVVPEDAARKFLQNAARTEILIHYDVKAAQEARACGAKIGLTDIDINTPIVDLITAYTPGDFEGARRRIKAVEVMYAEGLVAPSFNKETEATFWEDAAKGEFEIGYPQDAVKVAERADKHGFKINLATPAMHESFFVGLAARLERSDMARLVQIKKYADDNNISLSHITDEQWRKAAVEDIVSNMVVWSSLIPQTIENLRKLRIEIDPNDPKLLKAASNGLKHAAEASAEKAALFLTMLKKHGLKTAEQAAEEAIAKIEINVDAIDQTQVAAGKDTSIKDTPITEVSTKTEPETSAALAPPRKSFWDRLLRR